MTEASSVSLLPGTAERRQLTLMFCDLVDSVGLSVRLDPEDLRDLIVAYQRACAHSVERYDGYVARHVGDGILIYFGYPVAHEDNAERAIRAGLDLVAAVARLKTEQFVDQNVRVRVGIATGLVVVGSANEEGLADHDSVVGEAANLAARLQGIAEPDTVVVCDVTRQLARESFEYRDLGKRDLKGFVTPISAYLVIGARDITRFEAHGTALTPFVGRHEEIALLLDRWGRAAAQSGQVIALFGPGGMGKSRIAAELGERIRGENTVAPPALVLQCSPYHTNTPLYPVVRFLDRLAGIAAGDRTAVRLAKLARHFDDNPSRAESVSLIAELLGIAPDEGATAALDSTAKRRRTIEVLCGWFTAQAGHHPSVIVFEDVQWIDPTSKLLLGQLGQGAKDARALIAITLRTDDRKDAEALLRDCGFVEAEGRLSDHVTLREVRELSIVDGRKLAAAVVGEGRAIDCQQLDAVLAKSGGIPLYLEELVKAVASGFDLQADARKGAGRSSVVTATIDDILMAQLDRLGVAKEVAQSASVIGHEFQSGLLARIMKRSPDKLAPVLDDLVASRILVRGATSADSYRFKHSLIHDISYRSLLLKTRRQIHLQVAGYLASSSVETRAASDDLIAQHYALAGAHLDAIRYWRRGAGEAIARSANEEAIAMLRAALAEFAELRGPNRPELELDLVLAEAMAMRSLRGYSAPEVEQALTRAKALCAFCGDADTRFSVEWGLFQCIFVKGDTERAREFAVALLGQAGCEAGAALVDAHLANGMVAFDAGDFASAIRCFEAGAALCRPETDQPRFLTHGQNAGLFCLSYLARAECHAGHLDRGRTTIERARSIAGLRSTDPGHIHSSLNVAIHAVRVYHLCGDLEMERRLAQETVKVARHNHYAYYEALAKCHLGWVAGMNDDLDDGIAMLTEGLAALKKTGTILALPGFYLLLAQLYVRVGRFDEAAEVLGLAASSRGHAVWDAEIERVQGDIVAANWQAAEAAYRSGLAIARRQQAGLFACKAALSLARLLQSRGRRQEGHQVLKEGLAELREGEDVAVVRQARATLAELVA